MTTRKLTALILMLVISVLSTLMVGCAANVANEQAVTAKQQEPLTYASAPYAKLSSEAFVDDYNGKGVSFRVSFKSEFTFLQAYTLGGMKTEGRIFINHQDVSYKDGENGFGSSDNMIPPFALSIEKAKSDIIYELKRGDIIEVKGLAQKDALPGKQGLHIMIHEIKKVAQP